MTNKRIFGIFLLGLMLAPGAALADRGKDESGKRRGQAKQFSKQQEKLWEQERKSLEKQREQQKKFAEKRRKHFEKLREKEQKRREKDRKEQKKQWERHQKDMEKRRERSDEWWDRRVPLDVPPPQRRYPVPHHRRDGYGTDPHWYDSPGYAPPRRSPLPPPVDQPGYDGPPTPRHPPRRHHDSIEPSPSGYYDGYWEHAYGGYEPRPNHHEDVGPRQFEYWEDQLDFRED